MALCNLSGGDTLALPRSWSRYTKYVSNHLMSESADVKCFWLRWMRGRGRRRWEIVSGRNVVMVVDPPLVVWLHSNFQIHHLLFDSTQIFKSKNRTSKVQFRFYEVIQKTWSKEKKCLDRFGGLNPTWIEHATFWSGVRRATIAPRILGGILSQV